MATVQQLAKELGMTSQEIMARLASMGKPAESHLSPVDETAIDRLRRESPNGRPGTGATSAGGSGAPREAALGAPSSTTEEQAGAEDAPRRPAPAEAPRGPERKPSHKRSIVNQILELPILIVVAFGIAVIIKILLVQAFFIPSGSMKNTLKVGDRVLVEKVGYRFGDPERGQVIVFERFVGSGAPPDLPWTDDARNFVRELLGLPTGSQEDFIKRIAGVGGDVIRYDGSPRHLVVNGNQIREPYIRGGVDRASSAITTDNCRSMQLQPAPDGCRIPAGTVFVMGDNRGNSQDSRFFGPVAADKIVGRAFVIIWPFKDVGGI